MPPLKDHLEIEKITNGNQFTKSNLIVTLPENWNFLNGKEQTFASFNNKSGNVIGKIFVYPYNSENSFNKLFEDYIDDKDDINFEWISQVKNYGWFAKGKLERVEDFLEGKKEYYTMYLALYFSNKNIYELMIVQVGKETDFESDALKIIRNIQFSEKSQKISWARYGIQVFESENWISKSTRDNEIISWTHKTLPIFLNLSLIKKMKSKNDFKKEVLKEINLFRVFLFKTDFNYDFNIQLGRVTENKKKAVVFHAVGERNKKNLGVRKYYFSKDNYLFESLIWYDTKDWQDEIGEEVIKVLKSIKLYRK